MRNIQFILLICFFTACGYVPASKISSKIFNEKIYVEVQISKQDPRNSVFIVDTLRETILNKLNKTPTLKNEADDTILVTMNNLTFTPIVYDENGYVVAYKAGLELMFNVTFKDQNTQVIVTKGSYDFAISPNSTISDSARLDAVRSASSEAFDEFISIIAVKGQKNEY